MLDYQRLIYPQMSARPWMNQSHLVMKFELASIRNRVSSNISKPFLNEERVESEFSLAACFFLQGYHWEMGHVVPEWLVFRWIIC